MRRKVLLILFFVLVSVVCGQRGRRGVTNTDGWSYPTESSDTSSSNQWNSQRPNQQSSGFNSNQRESEYNQRPNQQHSSAQHTNNRDTDHNQRPNQEQHDTNRDRDRERPNQQSFNNNRETEYNQRPNQQISSGSSGQHTDNRETEYNQKPNQQHGNNRDRDRDKPNQQSFNNNRETEYNQRPNQEHSSGSFGQQTNHRETEHNQRPNQQHGNNRDKPNKESSGSSNNPESEYNQRPNQQQSSGNSGQSGTDKKPSGNQYAMRPPTMGSLQPDGSKPFCYSFFGCYSQSEPWTSKLRPVPAPLPPENNSASFYFYSRPNVEQRYLINVYPEFSLGEAKFDSRKPTVIIIHGFIQDGNQLWMEEMKDAYLKHVDANAMIVDWGKGSRKLSYLQAAGNTRLIGSMIAYLIKRLMEGHRADPSTFHIIGHSLGAQIASYAGKEVPRIARITALDPAQPGFEGFDKAVRLDKSDAEFVDVVHTNAKPFIPTLGLGMIQPHGHVDFYMNGGFDQPLCVAPPMSALNKVKSILDLANLPVEWFSQTFFCDHARAFSYLIEAFNNTDCVFWGHKANLRTVAQGVANTLTQGFLAKYVALSSSCDKDNCVPLGFDTLQSSLRGSYVVTTNGKFPYCRPEPGAPSQKGGKKQTSAGKNLQ